MEMTLTVNGTLRKFDVSADKRLIDILRDDLDLTGCKEGCGEGECGACTVIINGRPVNSCLTLAAGINGAEVTTIEGLAQDGVLSILQTAFVEETAIQCGYCTPGMIMSCEALLRKNPNPTENDVKNALAGNLCRCSGYTQIIRAVLRAARERKAEK